MGNPQKTPIGVRIEQQCTVATFEEIRRGIMELFPGKDSAQRWRTAFMQGDPETYLYRLPELAVIERVLGITLHNILDPVFDFGQAEREMRTQRDIVNLSNYGMGQAA